MSSKETFDQPSIRYVIIAHEKGTDNYVLATEGGDLLACGEAMVEGYRRMECLISFDEMSSNVMDEQRRLEQDNIIPKGSAIKYYNRKMSSLLIDAGMYLGYPPKDLVDFYSIPKSIVDAIGWSK